jgi:branched-chain amino acid aminotransferase
VLDAVTANGLRDCYIRPIVMRTGEQLGFYPVGVPVETFIIAVPWGSMLGPQASVEGITVGVSSWRRPAPDTLPTLAKAGGNYLISQLAKMEAREHGYAEGLLLDATGHVAEGGAENVFLVRNGAIVTPPIGAAILPGITRRTVMQLAGELGFLVREQTIPREALYGAHELFLTGTAIEVCPIRAVDGLTVGEGKPGPITRAIQERYAAAVRGHHGDASAWLTYVSDAAA